MGRAAIPLFECVPNVSEGRDAATIAACALAVESEGARLAHVTSDAVHNRSVLTFFGDAETIVRAAVALATVATERIDLRVQRGAHPRIGALDVLPVVPARDATLADAARVTASCAAAIWEACAVPSLFYGAASASGRTLPDARRGDFEGLFARAESGEAADVGSTLFHESAGTIAAGAREMLVAFNIVLATGDLALAKSIARRIRESGGGLRTLRAIGIALGAGRVQVSCNLTDHVATPIPLVVAIVRALAADAGVCLAGCELIGLLPRAALLAVATDAMRPRAEGSFTGSGALAQRLRRPGANDGAVSTTTRTAIQTINPATGETLGSYERFTQAQIDETLDRAVAAQKAWRRTSFEERAALMREAAAHMRADKRRIAELATREMGKTIGEAEAEVEKCATCCDHYAESAAHYLANEDQASSATHSYVAYRPLGVVLAIMPWNFPYWQVFRFAAPALMAGNAGILKHAANVTECALEIERIFLAAGFAHGLFSTIVVGGSDMDGVVADPRIAAVTLTGSEGAGSAVAATAGKNLKKTVLELGGSDAFIVLADADVELAASIAVRARFQNAGQSCIAAKRFIVEAPVYDAFLAAFVRETAKLRVGDPMDPQSQMGPLARADLRDDLTRQVRETVAAGGRLLTGGDVRPGEGAYYEPTIVADVTPGMAMFDEETFGPTAAVVRANDERHAIDLANASQYGLGGNLWTRDIARAERVASELESGAVFINGMTASDSRLPFGGVKKSGYGRELSAFGIREFVNIQTVWIGPSRDANAHVGPASE